MRPQTIVVVLVAIAGAGALCLVAFLVFFRYQYITGADGVDRVDRLTGQVCMMPCLPKPSAAPVDVALEGQRAIAAVRERPDAQALAETTSDTEGNLYRWSAKPTNDRQVGSGDPTYLVCYCLPNASGYRWEVHLKSREIFYVNDNATLAQRYGIVFETPSPTPRPVDADAVDRPPNTVAEGVVVTPAPRETPPPREMDDANQSVTTPAETVRRFYNLIGQRDYAAAYALLSPDYQRHFGYEKWRAGYATTVSSEADVTETNDPTNVPFTLTATDQSPSGTITRVYAGRWSLIGDGQQGWFLDDGRLHLLSTR